MRQIHAERGLVSLGLPICDFGVAGDRVFCNWFEFQPLRAVDQEHEKAKFKDGLGGDGQDSVAYLWERSFPSDYKCSRENRTAKTIWEAVGSWFPALRVRFFARALRALVSHGSGLNGSGD